MRSMTLEQVVDMIGPPYGVTLDDIKSRSRGEPERSAREAYYYYSRRLTARSWKQIARFIERCDHTTAMHGARKFEARVYS